MAQLILFNKPYGVLSQFTDSAGRRTLADYIDIANVYPAGRLDRDSEGLLLLTEDGALAHRLTSPMRQTWKTYLAQVEGIPDPAALQALRRGVMLKDGLTRPAKARQVDAPEVWPRDPPIRHRAKIPTSWIELQLREGRNRQVRRMTAAVGCPTLRLIRIRVGDWTLDGLLPGQSRSVAARYSAAARAPRPADPQGQQRPRAKAERTIRPKSTHRRRTR